MAAGVKLASVDCTLFFQPETIDASPLISASQPFFAVIAGSSFFGSVPTDVSIMSPRLKNSVSVGPGIRLVSVTPSASLISFWIAATKLSTNALVPLYTAWNEPGM